MKTTENLSPKNSTTEETKIIKMKVTPAKSVRPQKSMMRVKSFKPSKTVGVTKVKVTRS